MVGADLSVHDETLTLRDARLHVPNQCTELCTRQHGLLGDVVSLENATVPEKKMAVVVDGTLVVDGTIETAEQDL